jgi:hypothetical protein
VEGTSSYGAGLARWLAAQGVRVVEVNRPNRQKRRQKGKSDVQDAINAAAAVQSGDATAIPKAGTGPAAAVAALRTVRASAVKSRTVALNQLDSLIVTAPAALRESLTGLSDTQLLAHCAELLPAGELSNPLAATHTALRRLARRIHLLTEEIRDADAELRPLLSTVLPATMALRGVGPDTAGQLLTTLADNPERFTTEARFAHLCGVAPLEASSGRTDKHRLNRGGDRQANAALYRIVIVRLRHCERTKTYVQKRTAEGKTKRDIIRCLKRYAAREIYHTLRTDLAALNLAIST